MFRDDAIVRRAKILFLRYASYVNFDVITCESMPERVVKLFITYQENLDKRESQLEWRKEGRLGVTLGS